MDKDEEIKLPGKAGAAANRSFPCSTRNILRERDEANIQRFERWKARTIHETEKKRRGK